MCWQLLDWLFDLFLALLLTVFVPPAMLALCFVWGPRKAYRCARGGLRRAWRTACKNHFVTVRYDG